jgi:ribosome biogenesis GTPase
VIDGTEVFLFCILKCGELPVVNDMVELEKREDKYFVVGIMPRKNLIARYDFYKERHQGLAANVDTVFIVTSASKEFSLNRIRRFISLCEGQNVRVAVVVTKIDTAASIPQVDIPGVKQININALDAGDVAKLAWDGTALLIGSSGVGKSTILNTLCGLGLKTREVQGERLGNKGRHTTSARTLYFLPDGRRIIDTPGVRIVGVEGESAQTRRNRNRKS